MRPVTLGERRCESVNPFRQRPIGPHPRISALTCIALSLAVQRNMLMIDSGEGLFKAAGKPPLLRTRAAQTPESKQ
jgi:hypothetical protein